MYSRPSTEVNLAPCALRKKIGVPPTPLNARTGLCTPPGDTRSARSKYLRERSSLSSSAGWGNIFNALERTIRFHLPIPSCLAYFAPYVMTNCAPARLNTCHVSSNASDLNARTGLCTPPGDTRSARSKYLRERSSLSSSAGWGNIFNALERTIRFHLPIPSCLAYFAPYVMTNCAPARLNTCHVSSNA